MCPKNENNLDTPRTKRQFIFSVDGIHCSNLRSYSGKQQLLLGIFRRVTTQKNWNKFCLPGDSTNLVSTWRRIKHVPFGGDMPHMNCKFVRINETI